MRCSSVPKHVAVSAGLIAAAAGAASPAAAQQQVTVTINLTITATATVDVAEVKSKTRAAIMSFMGQRGNLITTSGPDTSRAHARLGGGTLFGGSGDAGAPVAGFGFGEDERGVSRPRTGLGAFGRQGAMLGYDGSRGSGGGLVGGLASGSARAAGTLDGDPASAFGRSPRGPLGTVPGFASGFAAGSENRAFGSVYGTPFGGQREYPDAVYDTARTGPSAFRFSGNAEEGMGRFAFATSLAQLRAAAEAQDQAKRASVGFSPAGAPAPGREGPTALASPGVDAPENATQRPSGLGIAGGQGLAAPASSAGKPGSIDIWAEGSSSYFTTSRIDGRRQGHAAIAHAGIDMIVVPGLLVGVMASTDWMAETSTTVGGNRDGRGWMAGPYFSARLTQNLYLDARYAWGQSTNHIDPVGAFIDTFSTTRQLASAKLTGDWSRDAWRFRPSAEVIWFTETQQAYVNQIGIDIASNTFSLGRTLFGPEVGYRMRLSDKSVLEPFVGLKGVWDFARTEETTATGTPIAHDGLRGRVEAGLSYRMPRGVTIRGAGSYDGIGSTGYRAVQGQARLVVPLQ